MIQIKAKQQNVSFEKNVEKLAFVLTAHLYNTLEAGKVIEEAAKRSGMSEGVIKAAWDAAAITEAPPSKVSRGICLTQKCVAFNEVNPQKSLNL